MHAAFLAYLLALSAMVTPGGPEWVFVVGNQVETRHFAARQMMLQGRGPMMLSLAGGATFREN